uniref:OSJNBb0068N06.21 protein n=1 Tax=Oryza sativa subsp. japonica TaxID=39947 RepID=Q7F9Q9_ORYSJ|nr:OSJNBb0068N06.21 [Oryza sativa Japonica Group]
MHKKNEGEEVYLGGEEAAERRLVAAADLERTPAASGLTSVLAAGLTSVTEAAVASVLMTWRRGSQWRRTWRGCQRRRSWAWRRRWRLGRADVEPGGGCGGQEGRIHEGSWTMREEAAVDLEPGGGGGAEEEEAAVDLEPGGVEGGGGVGS